MWGQYQNEDYNNRQNDIVNYNMSDAVDTTPTPISNNSQDLNFSLSDFGFEASDFDALDETSSNSKRQRVGSMNMLNNNPRANQTKDNNDEPMKDNITGLKEWHSEEDLQKRMIMTHRIMRLLQERKKDPEQKWLQELPHKALRLEKHLYKAAPSLEAYMDETTLKHRLGKVANAMVKHIKIEKANQKHREMASTPTPDWNSSNANAQQQLNFNPPVSQVITTPYVESSNANVSSNTLNQTQLLNQMLEMQKTLNSLMEISSLNGGTLTTEQQKLQQQMLDMQNQLMQLSQQTANPTNYSADGIFSSTQVSNDQPIAIEAMNNVNMENSTPVTNDEDLDIEFLQETFGDNNNVAV